METPSPVMQPDYDKLEQVLHYIIHHVGGLPHVGKPVLYKLLYFCDFNYYEIYEEPLTGEQYYKLISALYLLTLTVLSRISKPIIKS